MLSSEDEDQANSKMVEKFAYFELVLMREDIEIVLLRVGKKMVER